MTVIAWILSVFVLLGFTVTSNFKIARVKQRWDARALSTMALVVALVTVSDVFGSMFWLVPGLQSFESIRQIFLFLSPMLFGLPGVWGGPFLAALVADAVSGVFSTILFPGYFIELIWGWVAFKMLGKDPDFRKGKTWALWLIHAAVIWLYVAPAWGWICGPWSHLLPVEVSYLALVPSIQFTVIFSLVLTPFVCMAALPLVKRYGLYWRDIPGFYSETPLGSKKPTYETGKQ